MPPIVYDISQVATIIGLLLTGLLLYSVRSIKNSFRRRARLPDQSNLFAKLVSTLAEDLLAWNKDSRTAVKTIADIIGLLNSAKDIVPSGTRRRISTIQSQLQRRKWYHIRKKRLTDISKDEAWDAYTGFCSVQLEISQLAKNIKWE